jgi:hypothetical protein
MRYISSCTVAIAVSIVVTIAAQDDQKWLRKGDGSRVVSGDDALMEIQHAPKRVVGPVPAELAHFARVDAGDEAVGFEFARQDGAVLGFPAVEGQHLPSPAGVAQAMFYSPGAFDAQNLRTPPPATDGLSKVSVGGVQLVGLHFWFENASGARFTEAAAAGMGAHVTMHLRSNVGAFLTVWMRDATHDSLELTPRSDAGPQGEWTGYRLPADREYVVPRDFVIVPGDAGVHLAMLLARSQTEQVATYAQCQEKITRIANRPAADGQSELATQIDRATAGQIGRYVVNRRGAQTGADMMLHASVTAVR